FSVLAGLVLTGCVTVKEYAPQAEKLTVSKEEYELARKLLQAFVKNDADTFVSLLPEETRAKFTADEFAKTRKSLVESVGEPIEYGYLTTLELQALHPQIWKVRFKRWNVNRTKEFTSEILFKVVTGTIKKQAVITGFNFQ
ncbi:MAG: hypothetical protein J6R86_09790, partial [Lentisphaeria bacterium]|nr:hypothetical protein [Lentisphaeria bacterium]